MTDQDSRQSNCIDHQFKGDRFGYGRTKRKGKSVFLHRLVYCEHNGVSLESIQNLVVRHSCDNTRCINPDHLLVGTHLDNMRDKVNRGRQYRSIGELHPSAKISELDAWRIKFGGEPSDLLQKELGIGRHTISKIRNGITWKHIGKSSLPAAPANKEG
ncbi:HNH endonuclease signature motif containing protein [Herbaspirillum huttiense]|uniref:HNH endonuclease signature motif containing protein n=1 Tax=Herbaspirillum huttiense TaxID=863372 RepID=UPI0031E07FCC